MRFVWQSARKDFLRYRRNPIEFAVWIGVPIFIGAIMALATGGRGGPKPQAHVLVVDQDKSFLSSLLLGGLTQEAAGGFIRAESVELEAGRARLENDEASALLVIPRGFGDALLKERPCTLQLLTNPAQRILPGIVAEMLSIFSEGTFYVHRLLGDELRTFAAGPGHGLNSFPDEQIAGVSVRVNHVVERVSAALSPLLLQVETVKAEATQEKEPSFAQLFLPSLLFMSLLFMAQGLSEDLWREREQKTLRRVVVSPRSSTEFLGGKSLYASVFMSCVCLVALGAGFAYLRLPLVRLPLALVWCAISSLLLLMLMIALQLHASSQRAANIASMSLIFPLMMLGGSFFPFEVMKGWMVSIGKRTPNGWALMQLKDILNGDVQAATLATAFTGVAITTALLFLVSARRLRRGFAQG